MRIFGKTNQQIFCLLKHLCIVKNITKLALCLKLLKVTNLFSHYLDHVNLFLSHGSNDAVFSVSVHWGIELLWFWFILWKVTSFPRKNCLPRVGLLGKENHIQNADFDNSLSLHKVKILFIIYGKNFFKIPKKSRIILGHDVCILLKEIKQWLDSSITLTRNSVNNDIHKSSVFH